MVMIGERIKMLRSEKGLTMKDMAEMFDLSISAWNKYEKNEAEPKLDNIVKMADFFNVSLDFLMGRTNIRDKKIVEKSNILNSLLKGFESINMGDPSNMQFVIENLTSSLEAYNKEKVNEESLQMLLKVINEIIIYFNDLAYSNITVSNSDFHSKILTLHNETLSEVIKTMNNILYDFMKLNLNRAK
jgi:transcriptional regulator with XRE-family HTH domain